MAVVLSVSDYGESDKIITFYSPHFGRMVGIAKGAKRSRHRFVNKLELFSLLDLVLVDNSRSDLVRVEEADLVAPFGSLRGNYRRFSAAALLCELMLAWTREHDGNYRLFPLLIWALRSLDYGHDTLWVVAIFYLRLMGILGYEPHLAGCVKCKGLHFETRPYAFVPNLGGLACSSCLGILPASSVSLSLCTVKLLQQAQRLPLEKLHRLRPSPQSQREALSFVRSYGSQLLHRDINSWRFLSLFA